MGRHKKKVDIDKKYYPEEELTDVPPAEYKAMSTVLFQTFAPQWPDIKQITDVGCRQGYLLDSIRSDFHGKKLMGIDYFDWMREAAPESVKSDIKIHDLRDPLPKSTKKAGLVICTEVGEHIDTDYLDIFLSNLKTLLKPKGYLVITWSPMSGDHHGQHLSPLQQKDFLILMEQNGFELDREHTKKLLVHAEREQTFADLWRNNSLSVWQK